MHRDQQHRQHCSPCSLQSGWNPCAHLELKPCCLFDKAWVGTSPITPSSPARAEAKQLLLQRNCCTRKTLRGLGSSAAAALDAVQASLEMCVLQAEGGSSQITSAQQHSHSSQGPAPPATTRVLLQFLGGF